MFVCPATPLLEPENYQVFLWFPSTPLLGPDLIFGHNRLFPRLFNSFLYYHLVIRRYCVLTWFLDESSRKQINIIRTYKPETAVAQWLTCCATNRKFAGSIPAGVSGFSVDIKSFRSHYGSGVDSASNRSEYQEHFLGVKVAGA